MDKFYVGLFVIFLMLPSCKEENGLETLNFLFNIYENGEIDECLYNDEITYVAGINAYDAGSSIYDSEGNLIGSCNYAWGGVDSLCYLLNNCEVIYRSENHITGEPPVDKYGLGK